MQRNRLNLWHHHFRHSFSFWALQLIFRNFHLLYWFHFRSTGEYRSWVCPELAVLYFRYNPSFHSEFLLKWTISTVNEQAVHHTTGKVTYSVFFHTDISCNTQKWPQIFGGVLATIYVIKNPPVWRQEWRNFRLALLLQELLIGS